MFDGLGCQQRQEPTTQEPGVMSYIAISLKSELDFDSLFQAFEAPVWVSITNITNTDIRAQERAIPITLLLFQRRHTQKLIYSLLRIIRLHLLSVVVFILDPDISRLIIVGIFVLKVVAVVKKARQLCLSNSQRRRDGLFVARILHEIIVVGHGG